MQRSETKKAIAAILAIVALVVLLCVTMRISPLWWVAIAVVFYFLYKYAVSE